MLAEVSPAALLEAQEYLSGFECPRPDTTTSFIYARIRAAARKRGVTLPDPDYWVAAHALQNNLPLVTSDSDFKLIEGLRLHLIKT